MATSTSMTGAERVAKRRAALRAQGLRPKTFWLPDVTTPEFKQIAKDRCAKLWELADQDAESMEFAEAMFEDVLRDLDKE